MKRTKCLWLEFENDRPPPSQSGRGIYICDLRRFQWLEKDVAAPNLTDVWGGSFLPTIVVCISLLGCQDCSPHALRQQVGFFRQVIKNPLSRRRFQPSTHLSAQGSRPVPILAYRGAEKVATVFGIYTKLSPLSRLWWCTNQIAFVVGNVNRIANVWARSEVFVCAHMLAEILQLI
jgi:hypothetical protein